MSMLDFAIMATTEYIDHMPKSQHKKYGQFFTSKETAVFMAGLFEIPNGCEALSILILAPVLEFFQLHYWNACNPFQR